MISVIIPACNDEGAIQKTISFLKNNAYTRLLQEIIVVDSGSADRTVRAAIACGAKVVRSISSHRAAMMNLGAENATGKILYFLMPGAIPPANYCTEIVRATLKNFSFGLFSAAFSDRHWIHKALGWISGNKINFARLDYQSLFVVRELFEKAGRFRQELAILEDRELIMRMKRYSGYIILKEKIIAPAHSYLRSGILRSELGYLTAGFMHLAGYPHEKLVGMFNALSGKNNVTENRGGVSASLTTP